MAVLVVAAAAVFLLLSMQGSARAETCVGGKFCVWTGTSYTGSELNFSCSGGTFTGLELLSAQNHCGVNVRIGWTEGGTTNWKACMVPGGLRPEPGRFNQVLPNGC
ncbi:MAG: peptidase inhibitor family I36 protein [Thermoleophilia bacterium]|nr:peptidase inhibitor family I36 protein [Thermoleophilia bacterium]